MNAPGIRQSYRPRGSGALRAPCLETLRAAKRPLRASLGLAVGLALAGGGCGDGGGVGHAGADVPPALDPTQLAAAAIDPIWELAELARDTARFLVADVTALTAEQPDALAESTLTLPGRAGTFSVQWNDADADHELSTGDGLSFEFAGCAPYGQPDWRGVLHLPELTLAPAAIVAPNLFADLLVAPAPGDTAAGWSEAVGGDGGAAADAAGAGDEATGGGAGGSAGAEPTAGTHWIGSLTFRYVATLTAERVALGRGATGCSRVRPRNEVTIDQLKVIVERQPAAGIWSAQLDAELTDSRYGALSLRTIRVLGGRLGPDGNPGEAAQGEWTVTAARGGSVRGRVTGPGTVALSLDTDGDGATEQTRAAGWAELLAASR